MAGLFPGAPDLDTFWQNIVNKVDAVDEALPAWGAERFFDPDSDLITMDPEFLARYNREPEQQQAPKGGRRRK